ncbi:hypothetical protein Barb4_00686 [Bacteroidales bacterium Barb4]|nr:hypothetical protein Barb4_00686 [Bacteroidales bacterium Barb4]
MLLHLKQRFQAWIGVTNRRVLTVSKWNKASSARRKASSVRNKASSTTRKASSARNKASSLKNKKDSLHAVG